MDARELLGELEGRSRPGVQRILDTLKTAMRLLGVTNREVETRMAWSHGYLSRIFSGTIELRVEHVLLIVEIIGIDPAEFFDLAFAVRPEPPTPRAAELHGLLRTFQPAPRRPTATQSLPERELVDLLKRALAQLGSER